MKTLYTTTLALGGLAFLTGCPQVESRTTTQAEDNVSTLSYERMDPVFTTDDIHQLGAIAAGDIDGDGLVDILVQQDNGIVYMFKNLGDDGYARLAEPIVRVDTDYHISVADMNGDDLADIVSMHKQTGATYVHNNLGNLQFESYSSSEQSEADSTESE